MATTATQFTFDATAPFYAWVGASDLAVEKLRKAATDVREQVEKAEGDPTAFARNVTGEARTQVAARVEEMRQEAKKAQSRFESQLEELRKDAKASAEMAQAWVPGFPALRFPEVNLSEVKLGDVKELPKQLEARLTELQAELKALPGKVEARLNELQAEFKNLPEKTQARAAELQAEAKAAYATWESRMQELRAELNGSLDQQVAAYEELVTRGRAYVAKLRDDSISGNVEIIREDAEPVKDVADDVEEAAAKAAAQAEAAATVSAGDDNK